ncbi:hypothetical protein K443DRAFT_422790 [Laccaria amethystina LaAM-08-1]|uniref:Unplaced genomic scaffold K443scaffold_355, whole genome shotgun sequence n=1 Tax=Laccaria amethystina LaAM-08-1 TaxID=1095629 RepID=A0A0C9X8P8_9AGAR|nr:hypothetical protein K443DRAFT_422790 [Laccaria amethystina LaAM-08-1]
MTPSDAKLKFDEQYNLVTSYCIPPMILAFLRLLFALYTFVVLLYIIIWDGVHHDGAQSYLSYFTNLSYIGICAYFFASGVQTFSYARNLKNGVEGYPLQRWPRALQYLHVALYCTITTLPILVTIVYWVLLSSSSTFATPFSSWSNISKHALNSGFALFELLCTNVGPYPWTDLPAVLVILVGYLGVAYITHATQGIYTYSFLDPKKQGKKLAVYIIGIAVGACIIFLIARGIIVLRVRLTKGSRKASITEASEPLVDEEKKSESA